MFKKKLSYLALLLLLLSCDSTNKVVKSSGQLETSNVVSQTKFDLDYPKDNLAAFVKVRGSLDESEEVIFYANGAIYGIVDGERDKHLMDYELYNIGVVKKNGPNAYHLLTREVLLYTDKTTGKVLEQKKL